ncbi:SRPBCC family protein [Sphingomonas bacterium]|uniref:SRPBCC family protein n=1 Tax=Sphingomonas bacterium TaxID=1895847 RepID=UPI002608658F|nr:SRPBCC family protein [Sphingomonas bacterium]MDB5677723.1 hypothetical protein [Sphingomonas bacterium]
MPDAAVTHATFIVERSYKASPAKVFAALSDPAIKRLWFAASDHHELVAFDSDFRPGGTQHLEYKFGDNSPFPGVSLTDDSAFQAIVPDSRIVSSSMMAIGGRPMSVSLTTYELLPDGEGTDLVCTNQVAFFENSDGPVMREQGWRVLLDKLGAVLEG